MRQERETAQNDRGRRAERPTEIPAPGWRDVFVRVKNNVAEHNISIVAAGVAFYVFLSLFPGLAAMVSLYGLITDPAGLQNHMSAIEQVLPPDAAALINSELQRIAQAGRDRRLGWGVAAGILLALWSAAKGMSSLMEALNIVYDEREKRGFFKRNATALSLTLGFIVFLILLLGLIAGVPAVLSSLNLGATAQKRIDYLRWPLLAVAQMIALAVLYRYAPCRAQARWRWITPGAVAATILWLAGSAAFSLYVSHFASYNKTYGALGVVVILMTWLLLSVYSILLGAEINAGMEHQTAKDTTTGKPEPMGRRHAYVADTLGRGADEERAEPRH
ncbi:MAG TPA: YihY/virulence factor BrkB family protein [Candidatus Binatia bacterium]